MCVCVCVCVCVCMCVCVFWQHFFINTNFVEHYRDFLSTYFLVDPFILPYCFYRIRRELIDVFSIIVYIPSTFCPTLVHHQRRIYYKSDVTFVFALQNNKQKLQILEALHIRNMQPTLNRINFQTSANVFKCL